MDQKTFDYYERNAPEICQRYNSVQSPMFNMVASIVQHGARILDVGAGSGRDLHKLSEAGFEVFGTEPVNALRQEALKTYPALAGRISEDALPDLGLPHGGGFNAVVCCAVMMHVEDSDVFDSFLSIKKNLLADGYLFLSVCQERTGLDSLQRDSNGRLFKQHPPNYIKLLLERLGFREIQRSTSVDKLGRNGLQWINLVFQLTSKTNSRPIDQLEGILNNDKKDATYKLALIRSLADIANQNHSGVIWEPHGAVGIPINLVVDRWIAYYWPLIESESFIPQRQSEEPNKPGQIAFRQTLTELVHRYKLNGGFGQFIRDVNAENLNHDLVRMVRSTRAKIKATIIKGPVEYAGGSVSAMPIFNFDRARNLITLPQELWVELSLLSHWISESVILRWAEESARMGVRQGVKVSQVVDLLLAQSDPSRATGHVRELFKTLQNKDCVWTGKPLCTQFDIDHVIPFSLWRNNDLWNLLPADPRVNNNKRDRLPTQHLLKKRRDSIISYWEHLRDNSPLRFAKEAETLCPALKADWQYTLFGKLREAVELTAISRNVQRWEP